MYKRQPDDGASNCVTTRGEQNKISDRPLPKFAGGPKFTPELHVFCDISSYIQRRASRKASRTSLISRPREGAEAFWLRIYVFCTYLLTSCYAYLLCSIVLFRIVFVSYSGRMKFEFLEKYQKFSLKVFLAVFCFSDRFRIRRRRYISTAVGFVHRGCLLDDFRRARARTDSRRPTMPPESAILFRICHMLIKFSNRQPIVWGRKSIFPYLVWAHEWNFWALLIFSTFRVSSGPLGFR